MFKEIIREITPLTQNDCFTLFSRKKTGFTFPLHTHEELELNLILNAAGTQRIIGDHVGEIGDTELALVGPNLPHGWFTHHCNSMDIHEVTIQFNKDLLGQGLLQKNQLFHIKKMFEDSRQGLLFSKETVDSVAPRILDLDKHVGFNSVLELFSILHDLSMARNTRKLSNVSFTKQNYAYSSRRLERVFEFMQREFANKVSLSDAAKVANMSDEAFSRFIKVHTGYTFTDNITEIRLGHVSRMLIDTTHSVGEIAYKCGFNNMANFNRIFKERKGCTPKEFKKKYIGQRLFI